MGEKELRSRSDENCLQCYSWSVEGTVENTRWGGGVLVKRNTFWTPSEHSK